MNINSRRTLCLEKVEHRPPLEILQRIEELEGMLR
jgi:hypothetical protein